MDCWNLLGIDADADARAVKRQYARLLKLTRPDDDPDGFQRLREAYDQALAYIQWRQDVDDEDETVAPLAFFNDPEPVATVTEVPPQPRVQLQSLDPEALEAALANAQEQGMRTEFERALLSRCLVERAPALPAVEWAIDRLRWFSAWQVVDLEPAALRQLAEQLQSVRLDQMRATLADPDYQHERAVLGQLKQLLQEPWLQGFDQRASFHQQLAALLLETDGWSGEFFDRVCDLVGWDEKRGVLPIPAFQYRQLESRSQYQAVHTSVERELAVDKPRSASEKAAWFLLKPLSNGQRRLMVDGFDDDTWNACEQLEVAVLGARGMLNSLGVERLPDWRRWRSRSSRADHYMFWWPALFILTTLLAGKFDSGTFVAAAIVSTLYVVFGAWLIKLWTLFFHPLASLDVWLGERLLPDRYCRDGTGLLPLRHLLPSVLLGVLIWHSARDVSNAAWMGVAGALAMATYLNYVLVSAGTPKLWARVMAFFKVEGTGVFVWLVVLALFIGLGTAIHQNPVTSSDINPLCLPSAGALQQPELCDKPKP